MYEVQNGYRECKFKSGKYKNGRTMLLSKCAACGNKKSKFIKEQEAKRSIDLKTPLNKIPLLGDILF